MRRYAHNFCIVCVACVWNAGVQDIRRTDRQTDNKLVVVMRIAGGFIVNPQRICIVASSLRIRKECRNRQWLSRVCVRDRLKQFVLIPQESGRLRPRVEARKPHAKAMLPKPARQNNSSWPSGLPSFHTLQNRVKHDHRQKLFYCRKSSWPFPAR